MGRFAVGARCSSGASLFELTTKHMAQLPSAATNGARGLPIQNKMKLGDATRTGFDFFY